MTARLLARLSCYQESLPQGAPTSPALSNIAFSSCDHKLQQEAEARRLVYTRYADDLSFSSNDVDKLNEMKSVCERILRDTPFQLNHEKTRVMTAKGRIIVTGLVLNRGWPSVGRKRKRLVRSQIHRLIVKRDAGVDKDSLFGMLSFIRSVEPDTYERLREYAHRLYNREHREDGAAQPPAEDA